MSSWLRCQCGRECSSMAGLRNHRRACEVYQAEQDRLVEAYRQENRQRQAERDAATQPQHGWVAQVDAGRTY